MLATRLAPAPLSDTDLPEGWPIGTRTVSGAEDLVDGEVLDADRNEVRSRKALLWDSYRAAIAARKAIQDPPKFSIEVAGTDMRDESPVTLTVEVGAGVGAFRVIGVTRG